MTTLAEIRAKLQALDSKKGGGNGNYQGDKLNYAFWNIPTGSSSTVRFLPDGNQENPLFWVEKQVIKLPFPGVKGGDEHKEVTIQVPCMEMWDGTGSCPILQEIRPWWNDPSLEDTARKYWIKRSYIFQGFVNKDGLNEDDAPENPIRKFTINKSIYEIVKAELMDPDVENNPTDLVDGSDFTITKTQKGGWADYTTSKWARKSTPCSEAQIEAIDTHSLPDLATYLPKKPTPEVLNIIFEMFEASVAGELYDPAKWANYYKPYGLEYDASKAAGAKTSEPKVTVEPAETKVEEKVETKAESTPVDTASGSADEGKKSAEDILAMIRNRK